MSALAEALVAAQRRAIGAIEKGYVAGRYNSEEVKGLLDGIGCADPVDHERLVLALDVIRDAGAPLPTEPANGGEPKPPEPPTS